MPKANPRTKNGHRRRQLMDRVRSMCEPCWICTMQIGGSTDPKNPYALEVDELVPVSKGGSPTDPANVKAAHRCCNNWRSNKSVSYVEGMRARVYASRPDINDPLEFVKCAKAIEKKGFAPASVAPLETTTGW